MENKTIIIAASECQPFFASGGLGDVIGSFMGHSRALLQKGCAT